MKKNLLIKLFFIFIFTLFLTFITFNNSNNVNAKCSNHEYHYGVCTNCNIEHTCTYNEDKGFCSCGNHDDSHTGWKVLTYSDGFLYADDVKLTNDTTNGYFYLNSDIEITDGDFNYILKNCTICLNGNSIYTNSFSLCSELFVCEEDIKIVSCKDGACFKNCADCTLENYVFYINGYNNGNLEINNIKFKTSNGAIKGENGANLNMYNTTFTSIIGTCNKPLVSVDESTINGYNINIEYNSLKGNAIFLSNRSICNINKLNITGNTLTSGSKNDNGILQINGNDTICNLTNVTADYNTSNSISVFNIKRGTLNLENAVIQANSNLNSEISYGALRIKPENGKAVLGLKGKIIIYNNYCHKYQITEGYYRSNLGIDPNGFIDNNASIVINGQLSDDSKVAISVDKEELFNSYHALLVKSSEYELTNSDASKFVYDASSAFESLTDEQKGEFYYPQTVLKYNDGTTIKSKKGLYIEKLPKLDSISLDSIEGNYLKIKVTYSDKTGNIYNPAANVAVTISSSYFISSTINSLPLDASKDLEIFDDYYVVTRYILVDLDQNYISTGTYDIKGVLIEDGASCEISYTQKFYKMTLDPNYDDLESISVFYDANTDDYKNLKFPLFEREGYVQAYWNCNFYGDKDSDYSIGDFEGVQTLKAKYHKLYSYTYHIGDLIVAIDSVEDTKHIYFKDIDESFYENNQVIAGWFTDIECTNFYDFNYDIVTGDLDLYARLAQIVHNPTVDEPYATLNDYSCLSGCHWEMLDELSNKFYNCNINPFDVFDEHVAGTFRCCFVFGYTRLYSESFTIPGFKVKFNYECDEDDYLELNYLAKPNSKLLSPEIDINVPNYIEGWYTDSNFTNKWDFENDIVTSDIVLYPNIINGYYITKQPTSENPVMEVSIDAIEYQWHKYNGVENKIDATNTNYSINVTKGNYNDEEKVYELSSSYPYEVDFTISLTSGECFAKGKVIRIVNKTINFYVGNYVVSGIDNSNNDVSVNYFMNIDSVYIILDENIKTIHFNYSTYYYGCKLEIYENSPIPCENEYKNELFAKEPGMYICKAYYSNEYILWSCPVDYKGLNYEILQQPSKENDYETILSINKNCIIEYISCNKFKLNNEIINGTYFELISGIYDDNSKVFTTDNEKCFIKVFNPTYNNHLIIKANDLNKIKSIYFEYSQNYEVYGNEIIYYISNNKNSIDINIMGDEGLEVELFYGMNKVLNENKNKLYNAESGSYIACIRYNNNIILRTNEFEFTKINYEINENPNLDNLYTIDVADNNVEKEYKWYKTSNEEFEVNLDSKVSAYIFGNGFYDIDKNIFGNNYINNKCEILLRNIKKGDIIKVYTEKELYNATVIFNYSNKKHIECLAVKMGDELVYDETEKCYTINVPSNQETIYALVSLKDNDLFEAHMTANIQNSELVSGNTNRLLSLEKGNYFVEVIYPTITLTSDIFEVTHIHNFINKIVDDKYLKEEATCTHPNIYYVSCDCGAVLTETFESGNTLPHVYDKTVALSEYLKEEATCTHKAIYFKSCECGLIGTETFEYGEVLPHTFDKEVIDNKYLKEEGTCVHKAVYYKSCTCGLAGDETFTLSDYSKDNHKNVTNHVAKDSTLTEKGHYAYFVCNDCGYSSYKEMPLKVEKLENSDNDKGIAIVSTTEGFNSEITLEVSVLVKEEIEKTNKSYDLPKDIKLSKKENLGLIYEVKLVKVLDDNTKVEIQPSDIKPGTIIKVRLLIPEDINLDSITRILHIHSNDDIEEITFNKDKVDNDRYFEIEISKLSEFAFVLKDEKKSFAWIIMLIIAILYIAFVYVWYFIKNKKKIDLVVMIVSGVTFILVSVLMIVFCNIACFILGIIDIVLVILGVLFFLYGEKYIFKNNN